MKRYLWIDQYGTAFYGTSIADLKRKYPYIIRGHSQPMYVDRGDKTIRIGSVVGSVWLTKYSPVEESR